MTTTHHTSNAHPILHQEVLPAALALVHRGEAMGLIEAPEDPAAVPKAMELLLGRLWQAHVGRRDVASIRALLRDASAEAEPADLGAVRSALERIHQALRENPVPDREWPALIGVFSPELLAALLGISPSSVQRYARGERTTPEDVVARLHWLALVVGSLHGSYNAFGIRRWFQRSRTALDGSSPQARLLASSPWRPDDAAAREIEELARASTGMLAT